LIETVTARQEKIYFKNRKMPNLPLTAVIRTTIFALKYKSLTIVRFVRLENIFKHF
jgi:hypothetical protein